MVAGIDEADSNHTLVNLDIDNVMGDGFIQKKSRIFSPINLLLETYVETLVVPGPGREGSRHEISLIFADLGKILLAVEF